jgi:hypothetical protein
MLPEKGATVNCAGIGHHLLTLRPEPQRSSAEPAHGDLRDADLDGTDIYMVSSQLFNVTTPRPTLSSRTLKLISRIRALRQYPGFRADLDLPE